MVHPRKRDNSRRVKVFCLTCSFAPDDLFFPVIIAVAIKGTWLLISLAICISFFAAASCGGSSSVPVTLQTAVIGFTALQALVLLHKVIFLVATIRGTLRQPAHRFIRELLLVGSVAFSVEVAWAAYCTAIVLVDTPLAGFSCNSFRRPFFAFVILVWLNWLELAAIFLLYASCLDRCKLFCCRATLRLKRRRQAINTIDSAGREGGEDGGIVDLELSTVPYSQHIDIAHLCSVCREGCFGCRREGLNNSKTIALKDLSDGLDVLFNDIVTNYTALDRLSGWILVQKYHEQLTMKEMGLANKELLDATLLFLKEKKYVSEDYSPSPPLPLEEDSILPEKLMFYYWFAMAAYGWTVKVFLEPFSGPCQLCLGARCFCCRTQRIAEEEEDEEETVRELEGRGIYLSSAEVAAVAGIKPSDVILGRSAARVHDPPFFVCRSSRFDPLTGEMRNEVIITIRGTLSLKDVLTNFTASMLDATNCLENEDPNWFDKLLRVRRSFLGVKDAYIHTGFYRAAKGILEVLRKSSVFKDLVEKQHYQIVVTGHSLGAGVGAVLTMMLKHKHPDWSNGLHAYLYSTPGAVCNYTLAVRAEELNLITTVVTAHDIIPRISWRAFTYLRLLVEQALKDCDIKKQEVLCCSSLPSWRHVIFDGNPSPVGLLNPARRYTTPELRKIKHGLAIERDDHSETSGGEGGVEECPCERNDSEEEDGEEMEREQEEESKTKSKEERKEEDNEEKDESKERVERQLERAETQDSEFSITEFMRISLVMPDAKVDPMLSKADQFVHSVRVATAFLQEKNQLGPLMFLPGRVLHLEEEGDPHRWCGVRLCGVRCLGLRGLSRRPVTASWRSREDYTGIVLHKDCLVDHSPRRTHTMLRSLSRTHQNGNIGTTLVQSGDRNSGHQNKESLTDMEQGPDDIEPRHDRMELGHGDMESGSKDGMELGPDHEQQNGIEPTTSHTPHTVTVELHHTTEESVL